MPIVLNDGGFDYGTSTITINGTTYYIEDSNGTKPVNITDVPDEVGSPRGQVLVSGKESGTLTLQLGSTGSTVPSPGGLFVMPAKFGGSGSAFTASITEVSTPRNVNDYAKINVGWVKKIN